MKEGYGIYYYLNGNKYEGEWKINVKEGNGMCCCSNGDKYEGELKKDKLNNYGICYYSDGKKYEGEWENNMKNGYGIFYISFYKWISEGEWKNQYFSKGLKYKGKWKNDKIEEYITEDFNNIIFIIKYLIYFLDKLSKINKKCFLYMIILIMIISII